MTKICILDGYTTNPGDVSWKKLEDLGEVTVFDRTPKELILERVRDAQIIITNKTPLDRETIFALPNMRYIGTLATGYNVIDTAAARERGIPVCNVPTYCTKAVAQHTFALLLDLASHVHEHSETVRKGQWATSVDFCYWKTPIVELEGKSIGIIGFGNIGKAVADIALAMGMKVLVSSRTERNMPEGCRWVTQEELFAQSDVITIHCPLTPQTTELIHRETLQQMKNTAILINTSRGGVIHEQDLADALNNGEIAAAGLDVLTNEPPKADNPLLTAKNCVITPHIAWASHDSRERLVEIVAQNVLEFLRGQPQNVVN